LLNDSADGYFGANTRNAVFDVQHLAGLQPTGVVEESTALALGLPWP
jgi:peptidoglycan hydrolase-like protein with peptidoglycan-binding domain